jgi:hypothetical protein
VTVAPAVGGDLEVLPLSGEVRIAAGEAPTRRVRRRWAWALGAAVVLLGALIFPVRGALARTELDRIEGVWASVLALDSSRTDAVDRLAALAIATDAPAVRRAEIALDLEERQGLQVLARSLPAHRSLDGAVGTLRRTIALALRLDIADLQTAADARTRADPSQIPDQSAGTIAAFQRFDILLRAQRRRFGENTASPPPSRAALHSADAAVATLSHYLPVPVGIKLLVSTDFGVRILDLDRSTDTDAPVGAGSQVLAAGAFVVVAEAGRVYRLPSSLEGPRRDLGSGTLLFPTGRPDAIWIYDNGTVREITTAGDALVDRFEPGATVRGSVDAGLVVGDSDLRAIGVPLGNTIRFISIARGATVAAAAGDLVVWWNLDPAVLNVTSVATGHNRALVIPTGYQDSGFGAISPDGRRIAIYVVTEASFALAVIDLTSGAIDLIPGGSDPGPLQPALVWTPDSQRVFFVTNHAGASIGTWHIGDTQATTLRWRGAIAQALAVIP